MNEFDLTPKLDFNFSIEGNPILKVRANDRSGRALVTEENFLSSHYSPYLQFSTKYNDDPFYALVKPRTTNPEYAIPPNGREIDVLVKIWDKMPIEKTYVKNDEAHAHISIIEPQIESLSIRDCRERDDPCGDLDNIGGSIVGDDGVNRPGEGVYESIIGQVQMMIKMKQGWKYLSKIDIYASTTSPVTISEENYISSYFPQSPSETHNISITKLEPYMDYFISLVPYDNVGAGKVFANAYGYLCPSSEMDSCMQIGCLNFLTNSAGEDLDIIQEGTAYHVLNSEEPTPIDKFEISNHQTAKYLIQGKSSSGNTYYLEYLLTCNYLGESVGEAIGGTHMTMGASKMEFSVRHFMDAGECNILAKAKGEEYIDTPHDASINYLSENEEKSSLYSYKAPIKVLFGTTSQRYTKLKNIKIRLQDGYSFRNSMQDGLTSRAKMVIFSRKDWVDTELDVSVKSQIIHERDSVGSLLRTWASYDFNQNYIFESDKAYFMKFVEPDSGFGTEYPEGAFNIYIYNRNIEDEYKFLKANTTSALDIYYYCSKADTYTFGQIERVYNYPYMAVTPPQPSRDESDKSKYPDPNSLLFIDKDGMTLIGNVFDEIIGRRGKLDYISIRIDDSIDTNGLRADFYKLGVKGRISLYESSKNIDIVWRQNKRYLRISGMDIPYDGDSSFGVIIKFVRESADGNTESPFTFNTYSTDYINVPDGKKNLKHWMKLESTSNPSTGVVTWKGKIYDCYAHSSPYYQFKHSVAVKAFKTMF